jgi:hypothetical protein
MESQGCWRTGWQITRILLAILALVAFACVTTIELFGWSLNRALINPVTYTRMIQQTNLVAEGRIFMVGVFAKMIEGKAQALPLFNQVPQEGWQAMAEVLLPEPWVEKTVSDMVQAMITWMENEYQPLPEITIDFKPIQDNLRSQQGAKAVLLLAQYIPTCTVIEGLLDLFKTGQLNCIPNGVDLTLFTSLITGAIADLLPSQIVISSSTQASMLSPEVSAGIVKLHSAFQLIKPGLSLGVRLSLLFLSIYGLMTSVSLRRLLRSSPWPFYAAGILSIALIFFGSLFFRLLLSWAFSMISPQGGVDISALLFNGFSSIGWAIGRPWLWWGTGILSVGIILHLLWLTIESARQRRQSKAEE